MWTDDSALCQLQQEPSERRLEADAYLRARLSGADPQDANLTAHHALLAASYFTVKLNCGHTAEEHQQAIRDLMTRHVPHDERQAMEDLAEAVITEVVRDGGQL